MTPTVAQAAETGGNGGFYAGASTGSSPFWQQIQAYGLETFYSDPAGTNSGYSPQVMSAGGVRVLGGFVAVYPNLDGISKAFLEQLEVLFAQIKKGQSVVLPAESFALGQLIDLSQFSGSVTTLWISTYLGVSYRVDAPAITSPWSHAASS
ncbi:MAG: hypothetical protein VB104_11770 [Candidatus Limiplasma sp.]|nr:hypothetical protein [Candidatus Limiplasma sp.]